MNIKFGILLLSVCLVGCSATWSNGGSANFLTNTTQTFDMNKNIRTVSQSTDIKGLRTVASTTAVIATGNVFAGVTGAIPEAVDTTGEIAKASFSGSKPVIVPVTPESVQTQSVGAVQPIPAPRRK